MVVIVTARRTELEELARRFQTKAQAKFYPERAGATSPASRQMQRHFALVLEQPSGHRRPERT